MHRVSQTMSVWLFLTFSVLCSLDLTLVKQPFLLLVVATIQISSNSRKTCGNTRHVLFGFLDFGWTDHIALYWFIKILFHVYSVQSYLCQINHCFLVIHNTCLSPSDAHCGPVIPQTLADSGQGRNPSVMCSDYHV